MAASIHGIGRALLRISPSIIHPLRQYQSCLQRLPVRKCPGLPLLAPPSHSFCDKAPDAEEAAEEAAQRGPAVSHYSDKPWAYLETDAYFERYGSKPVWADYRRNHKGGIPPQKTRKTCIRGEKIAGNPCPICRDKHIIVHPKNVKLLDQFINPHSGMVYDPTQTGVCMKQHKKLNDAINTARAQGLLSFQIPYVDFSKEDYSNTHDAVGTTPPAPALVTGETWYKWYGKIHADEMEVTKIRKLYKDYLK